MTSATPLLLAIALDVDIEAGRTSGSVSCEHFMSEMIQHWIQTRGKDATIDVIVEALESVSWVTTVLVARYDRKMIQRSRVHTIIVYE